MLPKSGRTAERKQFEALRSEATSAIAPLNNRLSELTPAYNGIVYFATPDFDPRKARRQTAAMMFGSEAAGASLGQNDFYHGHVENRRISLGSTAFGNTLLDFATQKRFYNSFKSSRLNPANHLTYTAPVVLDAGRRLIGGAQIALDHRYGIYDNQEQIEAAVAEAAPILQEIGEAFDSLESNHPLWRAAGNKQPTLPNAYLLRWDTVGSTDAALDDDRYPELENYFDDMHDMLVEETEEFWGARAIDTGDGQNVVLYVPEYSRKLYIDDINKHIRLFGRTAVVPLIGRIVEAQREIAREYKDLSPEMRLAVGLGFVEQDGERGQVFWDAKLAEENETDPSLGKVRYTDTALAALGRLTSR